MTSGIEMEQTVDRAEPGVRGLWKAISAVGLDMTRWLQQ